MGTPITSLTACGANLRPDLRAGAVTLDTPRTLTPARSRAEWRARAAYIRDHILACAGLLPLPERTPLNPEIFEPLRREGYSVEKVFFESFPGYLVCGNLYRPLRPGKTRFPGIAHPHGHWSGGRLENGGACSVPGRCIELARRGFVSFSWDMAGYVDSCQIAHRAFGGSREDLWGIGALGIQLWNSIRALDFLQSLPDVDGSRIGCTGASGGGTQTFLLTAVDDRVTASAPVNMVSAHMQGGCVCENQSHLRVDIDNVEIAAAAAPRPQLLVAATGDWTANTLEHEYPFVRSVYRLFGAAAKVSAVRFDAPHNYHRGSREAVYAFFERWLLGSRRRSRPEAPLQVEAEEDLRVFSRRPRPRSTLRRNEVVPALVGRAESRMGSFEIRTPKDLDRFRQAMGPALEHALAAHLPDEVAARDCGRSRIEGGYLERFALGRPGTGDSVPAILVSPLPLRDRGPVTLLLHPAGKAAGWRGERLPRLVAALLGRGQQVLAVDLFGTGEAGPPEKVAAGEIHHFFTYNRTPAANQVQDILTALAFARQTGGGPVNLLALKGTGVAALLGRALAPRVGSACLSLASFAFEDRSWLRHCFVPGVRSAGDVRTALALAAPGRLFLHGAGRGFPAAWARKAYRAAGRPRSLRLSPRPAPLAEMVRWTAAVSRG